MTTLEAVSVLESIVNAETTDVSKYNRKKLIEILNEGRAVGISNTAQGGTRIHPDWLQTYDVPYDSLAQESSCYSVFYCPSVIKFTKTKDGFIQVGNANGSVNYTRVNTLGELNHMKKHPMLARAFNFGIAALYDDHKWKIYQADGLGTVRSLGVKAIFNDPTELPFFNITTDKYPIDTTTFEFVCGYLKEKYLNQIQATPTTTTHTDKNSNFSVPNRRR